MNDSMNRLLFRRISPILRRPEFVLTLAAMSILLLGALVYIFERQSQVSFVPLCVYAGREFLFIFGSVGYQFPSFAHAYAFTALILAALRPWPKYATAACVLWFIVECLLELCQIKIAANLIAQFIRSRFGDATILNFISDYFVSGTFDPLDIVAVGLGGISAYLTAWMIRRKEISYAESCE